VQVPAANLTTPQMVAVTTFNPPPGAAVPDVADTDHHWHGLLVQLEWEPSDDRTADQHGDIYDYDLTQRQCAGFRDLPNGPPGVTCSA